jgi:hypothetical protein
VYLHPCQLIKWYKKSFCKMATGLSEEKRVRKKISLRSKYFEAWQNLNISLIMISTRHLYDISVWLGINTTTIGSTTILSKNMLNCTNNSRTCVRKLVEASILIHEMAQLLLLVIAYNDCIKCSNCYICSNCLNTFILF